MLWWNPFRQMLKIHVWQSSSRRDGEIETVTHSPRFVRYVPRSQIRYVDQVQLTDVRHQVKMGAGGRLPVRDMATQKVLKTHGAFQFTLIDGTNFVGTFG